MTFIDGSGKMAGPAKAVVMTAEQEQAAADKLAKARASRAARKAEEKAAAPSEAVATPQSDQTPAVASDGLEATPTLVEPGHDLPPAMADFDDGESDDTVARLKAEYATKQAQRSDLEARATALGINGATGASLKYLISKVTELEQLRDAGTGELAGPMAYQADLPSDEDYEAAKVAYDTGQRKLNELSAELAGMPGRIDDAIEASDFAQLQAHRQRAAELPFAIEVARLDALKLRLAYQKMQAARSRVAMKEARGASTEASDEFKRLQVKMYEAANAAEAARSEHEEHVISVGQTQRELEQTLEAMRARK